MSDNGSVRQWNSLDHAMNFYRALLHHVESRGVRKVKDLYRAV